MKLSNFVATAAVLGLTIAGAQAGSPTAAAATARLQPHRPPLLRPAADARVEALAGVFPAAAAPAGRSGRDRARQDALLGDLQRLPWRRRARRAAGRTEPAAVAARAGRPGWRGDHSRHPEAVGRTKACRRCRINDADAKALATFLHSLLAAAGRQGSPPPVDAPPPNIVVGDASSRSGRSSPRSARPVIPRPAISRGLPPAFLTPRRCRTSGSRAASPRGRGGRGGRGRGSSARRCHRHRDAALGREG